MPELLKPILALVMSTLMSVAGTVALRIASESQSVPVAIIGASMWSAAAAGFTWASNKGVDLSVASAALSAGGLLAIQLIGLVWFGEQMTLPRFLAVGLIVVALILLSLPTPKI